MTKTENVIASMLTENTGSHMLDSGGAYGRNFERNKGERFLNENPTYLKFKAYKKDGIIVDWHMEIQHNLFHWLNERLEFDSEEQTKLEKFAEIDEMKDCAWLEVMEAYAKKFYDGDFGTVNTYNGEDLLSQVIQYVYIESEELVLLQIHGGCDVRGGYTTPKAFRTEHGILDNARAFICAQHLQKGELVQICFDGMDRTFPSWETYDGGFTWDRYDGMMNGKSLNSYEATTNNKERGKGKLYIDDDGNGYCPITGRVLEVYS